MYVLLDIFYVSWRGDDHSVQQGPTPLEGLNIVRAVQLARRNNQLTSDK